MYYSCDIEINVNANKEEYREDRSTTVNEIGQFA